MNISAQLRKLRDAVAQPQQCRTIKAKIHSSNQDIFQPRRVGIKAIRKIKQRGGLANPLYRTSHGLIDAREYSEKRGFSSSVVPNQSNPFAALDVEADLVKRADDYLRTIRKADDPSRGR